MTKLDDAIAANRDELERIAEAATILNAAALDPEVLMELLSASYQRTARVAIEVLAAMGMKFGNDE